MNYIIKDEKCTKYFYIRRGIGLLQKSDSPIPQTVYADASDAFCVYQKDELIHILCISNKNELVYFQKKEEEYKKHILCELNDSIRVKDIKITFSGDRPNFLYSAAADNEFMIVHCILGNHAMPSVIGKSADGDFFLFNDRVYYTNQNKVLGFCVLKYGKPDIFYPVAENAFSPYLCADGKREYFLYLKDEYICLNHTPYCRDMLAVRPVISFSDTKPCIIWQSGRFLKYAAADASSPPQIIASTGTPTLYSVQEKDRIYFNYAQSSDGIPHFQHLSVPPSADITGSDITNLLAKLKNDISDIEEKIKKLQ